MAVLFYLVMLTLAGGAWALTLLLFLLSRRSKSHFSRWAGALPLVVLTLGGVLAGGALGWTLISQNNPRTVLKDDLAPALA